jgi:hypothetical protein
MDNATGKKGSAADLQALLDAVSTEKTVSCFPVRESLVLHDGEKELGRIPIDGVVDVSLLDDSTIQKRYTVTRTMIMGPLVLLFPKKVTLEAYRICILWKDPNGEFQSTYIHTARRSMADSTISSLRRIISPEGRAAIALKAAESNAQSAVAEKEPPRPAVETSPFITCAHCTMEFRKADLPPGGKCPVCGHRLNLD